MEKETDSLNGGRLVMEPVDVPPGSINAEAYQVDIRDPVGREKRSGKPFTPEELAAMKRKTDLLEKSKYFALKDGYFARAVELCNTDLYFPDVDGNFVGAWLATEIDHWDNEKERVLFLTEKQLIVVKFNFITTKIEDHRKIPLVNCTRIQTSNLSYSSSTFGFYQYTSTTRPVEQLGLRIHWNTARAPGSFDFWNPWSREIPFITFMPHVSQEVDYSPPDFVNFACFQKSLIAAASADISRSLVTDEEPILIHVILGLSAIIHNQSKLGFSRDRGGVCY